MKKFFVIAAMLLAGFTASAQINIGAGYLNENWALKEGSNKAGNIALNGFYAGASYNIPIVEGLGVAPGAYFTMAFGYLRDTEGSKDIYKVGSYALQAPMSSMSIIVPVHVTYSMDLGPGKAFAYLGPAFQYGLKLKSELTTNNGDLNALISEFAGKDAFVFENAYAKDDSGNRDMKPFDVKLDVGFGYNWKFLQFNAGYTWGFLNRDTDEDASAHANGIHAGIAVVF